MTASSPAHHRQGVLYVSAATSVALFVTSSLLLTWSQLRRRQRQRVPSAPPQEGDDEGGRLVALSQGLTKAEVLAMRRAHLSKSVTVAYSNSGGLMITRGRGSKLYDETGREYLDTRNNVCHVGHCHPHVVRAVADQVAALNTNTRYLHPNVSLLAQRLVGLCPAPLEVVFFVNSGSEANDLALRLARAYTKTSNTIVFDGAYPGHTLAVLETSPYKYEMGTEYTPSNRPQPPAAPSRAEGGGGDTDADGGDDADADDESRVLRRPQFRTPGSHIWQCPRPDTYRGPYRGHTAEAGALYARYVEEACDYYTHVRKEPVGAMIMEGGLSIGGCILPPPGFLQASVAAVRRAGGIYIADEVQTGFGRCGTSHYWAFQYASGNDPNLTPDILTVGKPLGNGMPLAAVVTTRAIADSFHDLGVDYFNTFGGNPVCAAAGLAVLDVIERENLQQNATEVGGYLKELFGRLQHQQVVEFEAAKRPREGEEKKQEEISADGDAHQRGDDAGCCYIGDIRGCGLFMGVELVRNTATLEPATEETSYICTILKQKHSILTTIDGQFENVIIIKPPLVFSKEDADYFVNSFAEAMRELRDAGRHAISAMSKTPT